jgi:aspartate-semialdehyde dehydrogenase
MLTTDKCDYYYLKIKFMKVAVVGATGLVGSKMMEILQERDFPVTDLIPVASEKSIGKSVSYNGRNYKVVSMADGVKMKPNIAIFSAGGQTSLEWAPKFAEVGTTVIDNSSAWRMDPTKKLIVPEINAHVLTRADKIIANPNCSTIQMVMVMNPLHKIFKIKRVVVSTYQSVSGTGAKAVDELMAQRGGSKTAAVYPYVIDLNILPQIDSFMDNGYTKEEMKMVNETCKIMMDDSIRVTATTVRVPVVGGHSESVNIEFQKPFHLETIREILAAEPGVTLQDDPSKLSYPMPLDAHGKDDVFVGRIRRDESQDNTLNLWIVSDNIRKGAATNAVQIAEYLVKHDLV